MKKNTDVFASLLGWGAKCWEWQCSTRAQLPVPETPSIGELCQALTRRPWLVAIFTLFNEHDLSLRLKKKIIRRCRALLLWWIYFKVDLRTLESSEDPHCIPKWWEHVQVVNRSLLLFRSQFSPLKWGLFQGVESLWFSYCFHSRLNQWSAVELLGMSNYIKLN